ncbi:MAG: hypothetical protein Q9213_005354 [Squamulea squamosa]
MQEAVQFVHLEGHVESTPFSGLGELFDPPFYDTWTADTPASVRQGILRIQSALADDGPFDGAFAFSEGAAALMSALCQGNANSYGLKFVILIAPLPPFDPLGQRRLDIGQTRKHITDLFTILISGNTDPLGPLTQMTRDLLAEKRTMRIEWEGGHAVPNLGERLLWSRVVEGILTAN